MNPDEPRDIPDETLDRYMERTIGARTAALDDQLYAAQLHWTRMALSLADQAMEHEGISEDTRRRVATAVVFGSLDEDEAIGRIQKRAAQIERLNRETPRLIVTPELAAELGIDVTP
ncbi:MAG: hypothetical protein JWO67_2250 [Streptosporangiaceae bacterium]|nr:hypothetical protein [Streptosporangiaceae bacterium]